MEINKTLLYELFKNLDALDVPRTLRHDMATQAWYRAVSYVAVEYAIEHGESPRYQDQHDLCWWAIGWAELMEEAGYMMTVAEWYLEIEITAWRKDSDSYQALNPPWKFYKPELSAARQRKEKNPPIRRNL